MQLRLWEEPITWQQAYDEAWYVTRGRRDRYKVFFWNPKDMSYEEAGRRWTRIWNTPWGFTDEVAGVFKKLV